MGDQNTKPRSINKVEGSLGQGIVSQGPGVVEEWVALYSQTEIDAKIKKAMAFSLAVGVCVG